MLKVDHKKIITFIRLAFIAFSICSLKVQAEEPRYDLNIQASTLEQALIQLATQANLALYMPSDLTRDLPAKTLIGRWSLQEALQRLLSETDVQFELSQRKVLVLTKKNTLVPRSLEETAEKSNQELMEILVISEQKKRSQVLKRASNSVVDSDTLAIAKTNSLMQFESAIPGLNVKPIGEHNIPNMYLRGISAFDHTEAGEQSIAYYSDGILSSRAQGATALLYDINRIEIYRGPQPGRQGKGAIGGEVQVITNGADSEFYTSIDLVMDTEDRLSTSLVVNVPVTSDWSIRLAGATERQQGRTYLNQRDISQGREQRVIDYGKVDLSSYRLSSLYVPTKNQSIKISYERFRDLGSGVIPTQEKQNYSGSALFPGITDLSQQSFRGEWNWIGEWNSLRFLIGDSKFSQSQLWAPSQTETINYKPWSRNQSQHQELIWGRKIHMAENQEVDLSIGYFHFLEKNAIRFDLQHPDRQTVDGAPSHVQTSYVQPQRGGETHSIYANLEYPLNERWILSLSSRYSWNHRYDREGRNYFCSEPVSHAIEDAAPQLSELEGETCWVSAYNDVEGRWQKATGLINLKWQGEKGRSLYLSLASGWKPGGVSDGASSTVTNGRLDRATNRDYLLEPEENKVLEFGLGKSFFSQRLHLQTAIYVMEHENIQGLIYSPNRTIEPIRRSNGARSLTQGIEIKGRYDSQTGWNWNTAMTVISARYREFLSQDEMYPERGNYWNPCVQNRDGRCTSDGALDLSGNRIPFTPSISMKSTFYKTILLDHGGYLKPSIGVYFQSDMYFTQENRGDRPAGFIDDNDPGERNFDLQNAYGTLDFELSYLAKGKLWGIELFMTNATNKDVKNGVEINPRFYRSAYYWGAGRVTGLRYFGSM